MPGNVVEVLVDRQIVGQPPAQEGCPEILRLGVGVLRRDAEHGDAARTEQVVGVDDLHAVAQVDAGARLGVGDQPRQDRRHDFRPDLEVERIERLALHAEVASRIEHHAVRIETVARGRIAHGRGDRRRHDLALCAQRIALGIDQPHVLARQDHPPDDQDAEPEQVPDQDAPAAGVGDKPARRRGFPHFPERQQALAGA